MRKTNFIEQRVRLKVFASNLLSVLGEIPTDVQNASNKQEVHGSVVSLGDACIHDNISYVKIRMKISTCPDCKYIEMKDIR